jgi:hypothetical protein
MLRYALQHPNNAKFAIQAGGEVVLTKGGKGLNCSTFVLVFFQSFGVPLVKLETWQKRSEDAPWHAALVRWVAASDPQQATLIASDIGCARVRPEEAAGAGLEEQLPVNFPQCVANGLFILHVLDNQLTPAERAEVERMAYHYALQRGGGRLPPFDHALADEDFRRAAADVMGRRPLVP